MTTSQASTIDTMLDDLLLPAGAPGVFARTQRFEQVLEGLMQLITRHREPGAEVLVFPPVMSRELVETAGYLKSFPHLLGSVCCLRGDEGSIRRLVEEEDWHKGLSETDLVLTPAACYPIYPLVASRGPVAGAGGTYDVSSYCFRRETTHEAGRLQSFRMREHVCVGSPEAAHSFRARWVERARTLLDELALPYEIEAASDPFFGRVGKMMAMSQVEQELKFEALIPIRSAQQPTACMSFNCHMDKFSDIFGLRTDSGAPVHTACVAFGLERLTLALFANHGLETRAWPQSTRAALGL